MNLVNYKIKLSYIITALLIVVLISNVLIPLQAKADQFDEQIAILRKKVQETQTAADTKSLEVNTLKGKIASINAEIDAAQQSLDLTNLEIRRTQSTIDQTNKDLDRQKRILRDNLKMIYKSGNVSPLEVVASSKNLSDFVSQQQYLGSIKRKVDDNLSKINQLKKTLDDKKGQLNAQSLSQKDVVDKIASKRSEQQSILARTQGEEANFKKVIQEDNSKIADLKRQQAAIISSYSTNVQVGGTGGYPAKWANAPQDSLVDSWGMYNRECVSYTAWKVASTGRFMPYWGGRGNANQWPSAARSAGIAVDGNPRVGDVAISLSGYYGHAMYVESIIGNKVRVSQYNAMGDGRFSISDVPIAGLQFIHF